MFEEPDEVLARIDQDVALAQQRARRLGELQSRLAEVHGTAQSRNRDITVEVDASGALTDLVITDDALDREGRGLAEEVLALAAEARRMVQARLAETTAEVLGAEDPAARSLLDAIGSDDESPTGWRTGISRG